MARPATGDNIRTFAVLTCEPNAMIATILDRTHPDPAHLIQPFPDDLMTMWKIGRDVGNPRNNRPDLLDKVKDDLLDL